MISLSQSNNRVLITGATGGLGLSLCDFFSNAGYIVTATGRSERQLKKLEGYNVRFIKADLTDHNALAELCYHQDTVIHAAALSSSWDKPEKFDVINLKVTEQLLKVSKESGCSQFIYISTPSIYAAMRDQLDLTEESVFSENPLNDYARTKLLAERLVLASDDADFKTASVRPRAIVGPDDKVLLPKMIEMVKRKKVPLFRKGDALIELTDVRDVSNAVVLAARNIDNIHGQAINISGGKSIPVRELAKKLAEVIRCNPHYINIPMPIAKIMARAFEWNALLRGYKEEPVLTRYSVATLAYSQTFDLRKAREKIGFIPAYDAISTLLDCAKKGLR